ncbi:hypothetical protein CASFOL_014367 [Castilleja foliolosa]|uniref:OB domain-containing protein n=1 Tax=Castilleja foliolosa TaxID=1961234 RepID=A0ABD3DPJ9_9LAMI
MSLAAAHEMQFSQRVPIKSILGRPDKGAGLVGQRVRIGGWVKTGREADKGAFAFLEVNDGSCPVNLQVLVKAHVYKLVSTGASVHLEGLLKSPPEGSKQSIELDIERVINVGTVDAAKYPLPKTKLMLEFLRDFVHLRPRTNTMFQVTTLMNDAEKSAKDLKDNPLIEDAVKSGEILLQEKDEALNKLKAADAKWKVIVNADVPSVAFIHSGRLSGQKTRTRQDIFLSFGWLNPK